MIKDHEVQTYTTSDLTCACTLALKHQLIETCFSPEGKLLFIFKHTKQLELYLSKYLKQELLVEPIEFSNKLRNLKSLIYLGGKNAS